ncbi:helix-turn-helix protein [Actinocrispum wychmicini]|uniref:Helix-turn-helix protein n=2 Tax=Actinocrispum wychmicini TaxID=1213861 RepID=A0A4R2JIE9_9PSEU|nr:helix-turn-helix protein [Actinocrispum wychmicini]
MTTKTARRQCRGCSSRLAADNRSALCVRCVRRRHMATAPVLPDSFWDVEELYAAFATRDFGRVLRAYRRACGPDVRQSDVARWLGITQGQVSRIERRHSLADDLVKVDGWAKALHIPQRCLWFTLTIESHDAYQSVDDDPILPSSHREEGDEVRRRGFLKVVTTTGVGVVGGSLLTGSESRRQATASPNTVGNADVEIVREMTKAFRTIDNRHGGGHGHVRAAARSYLESTAEPLLRNGRGRSKTEAQLLCASAELYQLAGWMSYDTGHLADGASYLRKALRLCNDAQDDALTAEMQAAMSHHAAFFSQTNEFLSPNIKAQDRVHGAGSAVDLAMAARQSAKRSGLWALQSETAAMEAHGLALQKDRKGSISALRDAENHFSRIAGQESPAWLGYFDAAYLSAKFAHTLRDLGLTRDAEGFARRSLEMNDGYERGRLFNTILLASIVAEQGRVEEACFIGEQAVQMAESVRSVRVIYNLADLGQRLAEHRNSDIVQTLFRKMSDRGIPTPTS